VLLGAKKEEKKKATKKEEGIEETDETNSKPKGKKTKAGHGITTAARSRQIKKRREGMKKNC